MFQLLRAAILGPGFPTRLKRIQCETGWPLVYVSPRFGIYAIPYRGREYELWVENRDLVLKLSLMSQAHFALRLYPPVLEMILRRRNADLDRFAWLFFDADRTTWARLCCSVDAAAWTVATARALVAEMLPEVHRYDSGLRARGLM